jgi:hypothetical protein
MSTDLGITSVTPRPGGAKVTVTNISDHNYDPSASVLEGFCFSPTGRFLSTRDLWLGVSPDIDAQPPGWSITLDRNLSGRCPIYLFVAGNNGLYTPYTDSGPDDGSIPGG